MLIGVYLVFKVTTSYEKIHQDNTRSIERYVILWDVVKFYKILEIVVISFPRDKDYCELQNMEELPSLLVEFFLYSVIHWKTRDERSETTVI